MARSLARGTAAFAATALISAANRHFVTRKQAGDILVAQRYETQEITLYLQLPPKAVLGVEGTGLRHRGTCSATLHSNSIARASTLRSHGQSSIGKSDGAPTVDKQVEIMTAQEIRAELLAYQPSNAAGVITTEEFPERRQQLWRQLDWWNSNGEKAA